MPAAAAAAAALLTVLLLLLVVLLAGFCGSSSSWEGRAVATGTKAARSSAQLLQTRRADRASSSSRCWAMTCRKVAGGNANPCQHSWWALLWCCCWVCCSWSCRS